MSKCTVEVYRNVLITKKIVLKIHMKCFFIKILIHQIGGKLTYKTLDLS